jgi:broad specificity phosphatase PhoE
MLCECPKITEVRIVSDRTSRLICVRHGESENVTERRAGAVPHAGLTIAGHAQAELLAGRLRASGERIAAVYASDAIRAVETARHLTDADVVQVHDLAEVHVGEIEGSSDPGALRRTAEILRAWVVEGDWSAAVTGGESGWAVRRRVARALIRIARAHPAETVVVVGHVGSLTAGLAALCEGLEVWGRPLPHAIPFEVTFDETNTWRCDWPPPEQAPRDQD